MKEIKKIGALIVIFIFNICNICFADGVWIDPKTGKKVTGGTGIQTHQTRNYIIRYVIIGILVLFITICAVSIIRKIIKKRREKIEEKIKEKTEKADDQETLDLINKLHQEHNDDAK